MRKTAQPSLQENKKSSFQFAELTKWGSQPVHTADTGQLFSVTTSEHSPFLEIILFSTLFKEFQRQTLKPEKGRVLLPWTHASAVHSQWNLRICMKCWIRSVHAGSPQNKVLTGRTGCKWNSLAVRLVLHSWTRSISQWTFQSCQLILNHIWPF